jgi:glutathione S-transferase
MKLYHSSGSPNSRRVRILIAEKGLDIELAPVDLGAKGQFSNSYRAINPRAVVPTLVLDDGTAIGEVPAIMRYLDEAYPAGDRFSAADITTLVTVDFATKAFAMPIPDDSVALKRWYDVVSARPSATA